MHERGLDPKRSLAHHCPLIMTDATKSLESAEDLKKQDGKDLQD